MRASNYTFQHVATNSGRLLLWVESQEALLFKLFKKLSSLSMTFSSLLSPHFNAIDHRDSGEHTVNSQTRQTMAPLSAHSSNNVTRHAFPSSSLHVLVLTSQPHSPRSNARLGTSGDHFVLSLRRVSWANIGRLDCSALVAAWLFRFGRATRDDVACGTRFSEGKLRDG